MSANPSGPVHAFAPPLLRITPETVRSFTTWRLQVTGAASTLLVVKTAVPKRCGPSLTRRERSLAPELFIPAATPAPRKPSGKETITSLPTSGDQVTDRDRTSHSHYVLLELLLLYLNYLWRTREPIYLYAHLSQPEYGHRWFPAQKK